jgi:hypothetical protein
MYVVDRTFRFLVAAILAAFVLTGINMSTANAQVQSPTQIPSVSAFLANPTQLLKQNPNGGTLLANAVEQLALADPSTFKVLLGLLDSANDLQKGAIGMGLAQAAKIEVLTNQTLAADWQQQIAAITDPAFKTAAINAFGDVQLGALGGGTLGGGGGGPTTGGPTTNSSPENLGETPAGTPSFTFSSSTTGESGPSAGPTISISP